MAISDAELKATACLGTHAGRCAWCGEPTALGVCCNALLHKNAPAKLIRTSVQRGACFQSLLCQRCWTRERAMGVKLMDVLAE